MPTLICQECNTEVELNFFQDILECPNCGEDVNAETCKFEKED